MIPAVANCADLSIDGASPLIPIAQADLSGTDDLGRSLPTYAQTGDPKPHRYVGLFYWQWHGTQRALPNNYDITNFLKTHPKFMDFVAEPPGGPKNPDFFWAQPLFGYYRSTDPWVIRKHLPLLAAAGVDFLFMDYTNSSIYDPELTTFLAIAEELKAKGLAVPRLTFFLNYQPEKKIEALYLEWYKPGRHGDMWFKWAGKPLMMSPMPTDATKLDHPELLTEIQNYFTWRPTWALSKADEDPHLWRFLSNNHEAPAIAPDGSVEQLVVNKSMGGPIWSALKNGGVSATDGVEHTAADYDNGWCLPDAAEGKFFQAGWDRAMKIAPPILLVTGWNEWTASVWERPGVVMLGRTTKKGQGHIVDEFNMQFDRDLEPMKGGYGDDYYWQFVENMRRYKGMLPPQSVSAPVNLPMNDPSAWANVTPVYRGTVGDITNRDWDGSPPGSHYTDHSARNNIALSQVARDSENVYFHVQTAVALTPATDRNWMMLFIKTPGDGKPRWNGFDLLINRSRENGKVSLEQCAADRWNWKKLADVSAHWADKDLMITVPKKYLSQDARDTLSFDFKWSDNLPDNPNGTDFYTAGDTGPDGRFSYRFKAP